MLLNFTSNTTLPTVSVKAGGELWVQLTDDIGGGTVSLMVNAEASLGAKAAKTWTAVGEAEVITLPDDCEIQFVLAGASSPDLNIVVRSVTEDR